MFSYRWVLNPDKDTRLFSGELQSPVFSNGKFAMLWISKLQLSLLFSAASMTGAIFAACPSAPENYAHRGAGSIIPGCNSGYFELDQIIQAPGVESFQPWILARAIDATPHRLVLCPYNLRDKKNFYDLHSAYYLEIVQNHNHPVVVVYNNNGRTYTQGTRTSFHTYSWQLDGTYDCTPALPLMTYLKSFDPKH